MTFPVKTTPSIAGEKKKDCSVLNIFLFVLTNNLLEDIRSSTLSATDYSRFPFQFHFKMNS